MIFSQRVVPVLAALSALGYLSVDPSPFAVHIMYVLIGFIAGALSLDWRQYPRWMHWGVQLVMALAPFVCAIVLHGIKAISAGNVLLVYSGAYLGLLMGLGTHRREFYRRSQGARQSTNALHH